MHRKFKNHKRCQLQVSTVFFYIFDFLTGFVNRVDSGFQHELVISDDNCGNCLNYNYNSTYYNVIIK